VTYQYGGGVYPHSMLNAVVHNITPINSLD